MIRYVPNRALRALVLLCMTFTAAGATAVGYFTQGGNLYDANGQEIQVRGISHFGFNATILQPEFLWAMGWKQQIAQIKSLGFNAIRLPIVPDTLYNATPVNQLSYIDAALNPELIGKTPLQTLDLWMAEADRQGMYILLDFHSVSKLRQYPTWFVSSPADFGLIYNNSAYTEADWLRDLALLAKRYPIFHTFLAWISTTNRMGLCAGPPGILTTRIPSTSGNRLPNLPPRPCLRPIPTC